VDTYLAIQAVQAIGQVTAAAVAVYAVRLVYNYTKKKDRAEFLRSLWHEQQLINMHTLSSPDSLEQFEKIVYGDAYNASSQDIRRRFLIFMVLNRVQHYFFGFQNNLIDRAEYEDLAMRSLRLLKRQEDLVISLVKERGYSDVFSDEVKRFLDDPNITAPKVDI